MTTHKTICLSFKIREFFSFCLNFFFAKLGFNHSGEQRSEINKDVFVVDVEQIVDFFVEVVRILDHMLFFYFIFLVLIFYFAFFKPFVLITIHLLLSCSYVGTFVS